MRDNPALELYAAWDAIWSIAHGNKYHSTNPSLPDGLLTKDVLRMVDDAVDTPAHRNYQLLDRTHGIAPVAIMNGQATYALGRIYHNRMDSQNISFILRPDGSFRLGEMWRYHTKYEWGEFLRLGRLTFLDTSVGLSGRVFHLRTPHPDHYGNHWVDGRDWRSHIYYWRWNYVSHLLWMNLEWENHQWMALPHPDRPLRNDHDMGDSLLREYSLAEARYLRFRRKSYRDKGKLDPDRRLKPSEIEAAQHIAQHIETYQPPKARMLRDVTPSV